jgi:hypothetical protein
MEYRRGGDGLTGTVLTSSLSQSWRICDEGHGVGQIDETEECIQGTRIPPKAVMVDVPEMCTIGLLSL